MENRETRFNKVGLAVTAVHGRPQLEHWEALSVLRVHIFGILGAVDNSQDSNIKLHEMVTDYKCFYTTKPRMSGEFDSSKGNINSKWRWNQSNGQVIVSIPLKIPGLPPSRYYVRLLKFNNRCITSRNTCFTLTRKYSTMHKAWIMEIFDMQKKFMCVFYWCVKGYPDRSVHVVEDESTPPLSYQDVCNILDEIPDINVDDYQDIIINSDLFPYNI